MKSKSCFFIILCCLSLVLSVYKLEANSSKNSINREENLKDILEETFLKEEAFDQIATPHIAQKIDPYGHVVPVESIVNCLHEKMQSQEVLNQLMEGYESFSDEEIHELHAILENKTFLKYAERSFSIARSNMQVMDQTLNALLEEGIEINEPLKKKNQKLSATSHSEILSITKDNFHEEVEESEKPVILKVYADWCRPCQLFTSTFENFSKEYKDQCRFGKIDSQKE